MILKSFSILFNYINFAKFRKNFKQRQLKRVTGLDLKQSLSEMLSRLID